MSLFSTIPDRENGPDIEAGWFNLIKNYLVQAFPGINSSTAPFTIANNEASLINITGLLLDSSSYKYYKIRYDMHREDDGPLTQDEVGTLEAFWNGTAWETNRTIEFGNSLGDGTEGGSGTGTDYLVINGADGQAKYKSGNFTGGAYASALNWTIIETRLAV